MLLNRRTTEGYRRKQIRSLIQKIELDVERKIDMFVSAWAGTFAAVGPSGIPNPTLCPG
jgi:hypothetical protein